MKDIENDAIQFFEDQKIRVAWDEQQEKLKQAVLWLHRRTPMFFDSTDIVADAAALPERNKEKDKNE